MSDFITTVGQYFWSQLKLQMEWKEKGFFFSLPLFLNFAEQASLDTLDKVFSLLFSSSVPTLVIAESEGGLSYTKSLFW